MAVVVSDELAPRSVPMFLEYLKTTEKGGLKPRLVGTKLMPYWINGHAAFPNELERAAMEFLEHHSTEPTHGNVYWLIRKAFDMAIMFDSLDKFNLPRAENRIGHSFPIEYNRPEDVAQSFIQAYPDWAIYRETILAHLRGLNPSPNRNRINGPGKWF